MIARLMSNIIIDNLKMIKYDYSCPAHFMRFYEEQMRELSGHYFINCEELDKHSLCCYSSSVALAHCTTQQLLVKGILSQ